MAVIVKTQRGPVAGVDAGGVSRFLGIPYSAPPFGERRMRRPQPTRAWMEVRDASQYGATVPKGSYPPLFDQLLPEPQIDGEDCLNLNVWTPNVDGRRPVFVWVRGGAFMNGSGAAPQHDGAAFASDGVVSVNQRSAGGRRLPRHRRRGDQLGNPRPDRALEWVRDNIAAFGGDPARLTIGGESAGAYASAPSWPAPSVPVCSGARCWRPGRATTPSLERRRSESPARWRTASASSRPGMPSPPCR